MTDEEYGRICARNLRKIIMQNTYHFANRDYLQKQVDAKAKYLTEEQKQDLRKQGFTV